MSDSSRRLLVWLLLAALLAPLGWRSVQADDQPRKFAFIVGINKYRKRSFEDLAYAERDAEALQETLRGLGFEVVLLKGALTGDLEPTRGNVDSQLKKLLKRVGKRDLVLVSLSGHGVQFDAKLPDGTRKDDAYFCPLDAVANDPETLFSLSYLIDDLLAHQGGRNLVLVDACRDQPKDSTRGARGVQGRSIRLPENTAVMFSCKAGQQSYEHENAGGGHGLFTYCVLEGLRGQAARGNEITWSSLAGYVEDQMDSADVRKWMPPGREQIPLATGNVERTLLARITVMPTKPSVPKSDKPPSSTMAVNEGKTAGQGRDDNSLKMKLAWCPAGKFTMGSPKSEPRRHQGEDRVEVALTKGFWIGKYEVTQGEWKQVMGTEPWKGHDHVKEQANCAASFVSWNDAQEFCHELTERERLSGHLPAVLIYRLPTEAEWEYACRAGSKTPFSFGDGQGESGMELRHYCWWDDICLKPGQAYAHAVGQLKANAWGLHDMHGNVFEWCEDVLLEKLQGGTDPVARNGGSDPLHVRRGGGWSSDLGVCRSAFRFANLPVRVRDDVGFRLVLGSVN